MIKLYKNSINHFVNFMKISLLFIFLLFEQFDILSQKNIIIVNQSEKKINYVYKNCFEDNLSFLIKPNDTVSINIDSSLTLPIEIYFPNSGNLFYSVFCLGNDTLRILSRNNKLIINNLRVQETQLFEKLNTKDFYSQLLWSGMGYNSKSPKIDEHFIKCQETEKRALDFLDSLKNLQMIRFPIKKIIDLKIRLNILGTYLTPGYVWGKEITFTNIPKEYKDSVINKASILNNIPKGWSQYSQLSLFNYVRFLIFSEEKIITQESVFNRFKVQFDGINRDNGCFQTLKFSGDLVNPILFNEFLAFANEKKFPIYFKNKINEMDEVKSVNLFSLKKDKFLSVQKIEFELSEILKLNSSKYYYIDFWATWCRPCIEELPFAEELQKKYSINGIGFIYISIDENFESYYSKMIEKPIIPKSSFLLTDLDKSEFTKKIKLMSIPRYIIVNDKGYIINSDAPRPSDPKINSIFDNLLTQQND